MELQYPIQVCVLTYASACWTEKGSLFTICPDVDASFKRLTSNWISNPSGTIANNLGVFYQFGLGTACNGELASKFYKTAADMKSDVGFINNRLFEAQPVFEHSDHQVVPLRKYKELCKKEKAEYFAKQARDTEAACYNSIAWSEYSEDMKHELFRRLASIRTTCLPVLYEVARRGDQKAEAYLMSIKYMPMVLHSLQNKRPQPWQLLLVDFQKQRCTQGLSLYVKKEKHISFDAFDEQKDVWLGMKLAASVGCAKTCFTLRKHLDHIVDSPLYTEKKIDGVLAQFSTHSNSILKYIGLVTFSRNTTAEKRIESLLKAEQLNVRPWFPSSLSYPSIRQSIAQLYLYCTPPSLDACLHQMNQLDTRNPYNLLTRGDVHLVFANNAKEALECYFLCLELCTRGAKIWRSCHFRIACIHLLGLLPGVKHYLALKSFYLRDPNTLKISDYILRPHIVHDSIRPLQAKFYYKVCLAACAYASSISRNLCINPENTYIDVLKDHLRCHPDSVSNGCTFFGYSVENEELSDNIMRVLNQAWLQKKKDTGTFQLKVCGHLSAEELLQAIQTTCKYVNVLDINISNAITFVPEMTFPRLETLYLDDNQDVILSACKFPVLQHLKISNNVSDQVCALLTCKDSALISAELYYAQEDHTGIFSKSLSESKLEKLYVQVRLRKLAKHVLTGVIRHPYLKQLTINIDSDDDDDEGGDDEELKNNLIVFLSTNKSLTELNISGCPWLVAPLTGEHFGSLSTLDLPNISQDTVKVMFREEKHLASLCYLGLSCQDQLYLSDMEKILMMRRSPLVIHIDEINDGDIDCCKRILHATPYVEFQGGYPLPREIMTIQINNKKELDTPIKFWSAAAFCKSFLNANANNDLKDSCLSLVSLITRFLGPRFHTNACPGVRSKSGKRKLY